MKRFFRRAALCLVLPPLFSIGLLVCLNFFAPSLCNLLFNLLLGEPKILNRIPAKIAINGHDNPNAFCFAMPTDSIGNLVDRLVLWIPDSADTDGRDIVIIDRTRNTVCNPHENEGDHVLIHKQWLIQTKSGSEGYSYMNSAKGCGNPHLKIAGKRINFVFPPNCEYLPGSSVDITLL
jgi:hypothetical protein